MATARVVWVEGWDSDDAYLSDSAYMREDETEEQAIQRVKDRSGIVEVGTVEVTGGR